MKIEIVSNNEKTKEIYICKYVQTKQYSYSDSVTDTFYSKIVVE